MATTCGVCGDEQAAGAVTWPLACSRLAERGAHLLESAQWSDCVLAVGRERREVRAHRLLLALASPVLANLLDVEWSPERPVPVPDFEPDVFHAVLVYIYTARVEIASHGAARELYCAAQRFALPDLVAACSAHLAATLTPDNVCAALQVVEVLGDDERLDALLREQCLQLMRSDTAQVLSTSGFLSVRPRTVETLFAIEPLEICSEMELFRAAERYAVHQMSTAARAGVSEVTEMLRGALQQIRFLTVDVSEFVESDTSMLLSVPEQLAIIKNIISVNPRHPMPSGFSTSRTHRRKEQLEREEADTQRTEDEERDEARKREADRKAEQRKRELGALDPLRLAARLRFPVPLSALTSAGGFASSMFHVRGMRWYLWSRAYGASRDLTHLHVSVVCCGPSEGHRPGWRCAARGHVRVLRGGGEEEEAVGEELAFNRTFTDQRSCERWAFMSWRALRGLAAAVPANGVILEVDLSADRPQLAHQQFQLFKMIFFIK